MRIGSLFSGIGGLELGLERAEVGETVWQVEQDDRLRGHVLAEHWPSAKRYRDVKEVGRENLEQVDLICGGFPCQDVSAAGSLAGMSGSRSGLWVEFSRVVGELRPDWVVVENVASGAKLWVDRVCGDLGEQGYATLPIPVRADWLGAPYRRSRIFILGRRAMADIDGKQLWEQPRRCRRTNWSGAYVDADHHWSTACPEFSGVVPGSSARLARAAGNCVVPAQAEVVGHIIRELVRQ